MKQASARNRTSDTAIFEGALSSIASAAIRERIIALGAEPASCTPDQLAKLLANDLKRLEPIAKRTGARLD